MFSGAPAATAASQHIRTASDVHFGDFKCGIKHIAFLVFNANRLFVTTVDVGLVTGIRDAIGPNGTAIFVIFLIGSDSITPTVLACSYLLRVNSLEHVFLITLSSNKPICVSATANLAK